MVNTNDRNADKEDIEITSEPFENGITNEVNTTDVEDKLDEALKRCKKELQASKQDQLQLQNELQRARADFLNARKRLEQEQSVAINRTVSACISDVLPLYDSFEMAKSDEAVWNTVDENWRKGIEGIFSQLQSILQKHHVASINPIGEKFDPSQHEAVGSTEATDTTLSGTIQQVLQVGFVREVTKGEKELLRPARVIVAE